VLPEPSGEGEPELRDVAGPAALGDGDTVSVVSVLTGEAASSELVRLVTCGSVDDGKSTLIGRLLFDTKQIFVDQMVHIEETSERRGDGYGLTLLVEPTGIKRWQFKYKRQGKETSLRLGSYPELSISDARRQCDAAQKLINEGIDPVEQKREQRRQEQAARPKTSKFRLCMNDGGGMIIENSTSRIILNMEQVAALNSFLVAATHNS